MAMTQKFSNPGNGSAQTELAAILENTSNPEVNTDRFPIHWVYTVLPMAAGHPFAAEHLNSIIDAVLPQQQLLDSGPLAAACNSSRSCVLRISGPIAWTKSWLRVARRLCPSADGAAWPCLVSSHVLEFALATKLLTRNQAINRTSSAMAPPAPRSPAAPGGTMMGVIVRLPMPVPPRAYHGRSG